MTVIGSSNRPRFALGLLAGLVGFAVVGAVGVTREAPVAAVEAPAVEASTPSQALHFEPNPIVLRAISRSLQGDEGGASLDSLAELKASGEASWPYDERLAAIYWTVPEGGATTDLLAANWGLGRTFFTLNPDLAPGTKVDAGTKVKVYAADPVTPTKSIGHPNRGRLQQGMPMPEGDAWRLRPNRRRAFGTHKTISTLVKAFEAYGERFPDAPAVRVGEIASRRGGRAKPHASHRTGRDVDLGYIGLGEDDGEVRWKRMGKESLDVEKTWFLVHEMIKSGNVDTIFISSRLQRLLYKEAKAQGLSDDELQRIFQHPRHAESPRAIIKHWRGHVNHMHVRFRCEAWNGRCRGERKLDEVDGLEELELGEELDGAEELDNSVDGEFLVEASP